MQIKPLGGRVLVEPVKNEEEKKGGIIIPDTAKEKPQKAMVVALGTGELDEQGKPRAFSVKEGDLVLMPKYGGTDVKFEEKEYRIMREEELLAILG